MYTRFQIAPDREFDIAATQFEDGSAYHQYQPLTKKGNADVGSGFNDDPLWLILGTSQYIKETGDFGILDEMVAYNNDENNKGTLFEHLQKSFYMWLTISVRMACLLSEELTGMIA